MKKSGIQLVLVSLLFSVVSLQCSTSSSVLKAGSPLLSKLSSIPNLSSLTSLLQTPGLGSALGGALKGPFTLLAPTNDALSKLGPGALGNLMNPSNVNQLAGLLKNHIVPGKLDVAGLAQSGLQTVGGIPLNLKGANLGGVTGGDNFNIIPVDKVLGQ